MLSLIIRILIKHSFRGEFISPLFWRYGGMGRRGRLKIFWAVSPSEFESRWRYNCFIHVLEDRYSKYLLTFYIKSINVGKVGLVGYHWLLSWLFGW